VWCRGDAAIPYRYVTDVKPHIPLFKSSARRGYTRRSFDSVPVQCFGSSIIVTPYNNPNPTAPHRVGQYSELATVITAITRPYCNYDNHETLRFLPELEAKANATVIMVITKPHCNYGSFEPPGPGTT
jgi:hypothetical protein